MQKNSSKMSRSSENSTTNETLISLSLFSRATNQDCVFQSCVLTFSIPSQFQTQTTGRGQRMKSKIYLQEKVTSVVKRINSTCQRRTFPSSPCFSPSSSRCCSSSFSSSLLRCVTRMCSSSHFHKMVAFSAPLWLPWSWSSEKFRILFQALKKTSI